MGKNVQAFLDSLDFSQKLYLLVLVPLFMMSMIIFGLSIRGLTSHSEKDAARNQLLGRTSALFNSILEDEDVSKALHLDPQSLPSFLAQKMASYDQTRSLLLSLRDALRTPTQQTYFDELRAFDETHLKPLEKELLREVFHDAGRTRKAYFSRYLPLRTEFLSKAKNLLKDIQREYENPDRLDTPLFTLSLIGLSLLISFALSTLTIRILAQQVKKSQENSQSLLSILGEGLFFFDRQGTIAPERSQALEKLIPGSGKIRSLKEFVQTYAPESLGNVSPCLNLLWMEGGEHFASDFESTTNCLPQLIQLGAMKKVQLEYRPLYSASGRLDKVVVVVTDVTAYLQKRKEADRNEERVRRISRIAGSLDSYFNFYEESLSLIQRISNTFQKLQYDSYMHSKLYSQQDLLRDLHSLKGSLAIFEFTELSHKIHTIESIVATVGPKAKEIPSQWIEFTNGWDSESKDLERLLGIKENVERMSIRKQNFDKLKTLAHQIQNPQLFEVLEACERRPLAEALSKYESYFRKAAEKIEDKSVAIIFDEDSAPVALREVQLLDVAFTHLLRNCFDHGIEERHFREISGKNPKGTIRLSAQRKKDSIVFTVQDDGAGIHVDKLADKAVLLGLWTEEKRRHASYEEKVQLIFVPNFSSKDEVTELSGRGVGMDAVKTLVENLGGTLTVTSKLGHGTTFSMEIPTQDSHEVSFKKAS